MTTLPASPSPALPDAVPVPPGLAQRTHVDAGTYERLYRQSLDDPEGFWRGQASSLEWMRPFTQVRDTRFDPSDLRIRWFQDGVLNASANCLDRHLPAKAHAPALLWEGDDPSERRTVTWAQFDPVVPLVEGESSSSTTTNGSSS